MLFNVITDIYIVLLLYSILPCIERNQQPILSLFLATVGLEKSTNFTEYTDISEIFFHNNYYNFIVFVDC